MIHRGLFVVLGVGCFGLCGNAFLSSAASAQGEHNAINVANEKSGIQSLEIPKQHKTAPKNVMTGQDLLKQMEAAIAQEKKEPITEENRPAPANVEEIIKDVIPEVILKEREKLPIPPDAVPLEEPINKVAPAPVQVKKETIETQTPKADVENTKSPIQVVVDKAPKKKIAKKTAKKRKVYQSRQSKSITHKYAKTNMPPPLPRIKPEKPSSVVSTPRIIDYTKLPEGVVIHSDTALRIALEYAPPARSFTVYEGRQYKDRIVYQVTFRTEGGPHDILIDAENGDVLKK